MFHGKYSSIQTRTARRVYTQPIYSPLFRKIGFMNDVIIGNKKKVLIAYIVVLIHIFHSFSTAFIAMLIGSLPRLRFWSFDQAPRSALCEVNE